MPPEVRQNLAKFAAYRERIKSLGKFLPDTDSINAPRAAALREIQELMHQERTRYRKIQSSKYFVCTVGVREEHWEQLANSFVKLDQISYHKVVHKGLKTIRALLCNKDKKKYWFVEREYVHRQSQAFH